MCINPAGIRSCKGKGSYPRPSTTTVQPITAADVREEVQGQKKIAIIGSGAIGCYHGARLWEAGHSVKFLLRGDSYDAVKESGLRVTSIDGNLCIPADQLDAFQNTQDMGTVDWVIVAVKSSCMDAVPDLVYPLLSSNTRVLAVMNGLVEKDLVQMLKARAGEGEGPIRCCRAVYAAMSYVACDRVDPTKVEHIFGGRLTAGVASSSAADTSDDRDAFLQLWSNTKIEPVFEGCLLRSRWMMMLWNLPLNGLSVAMGGITMETIVRDPSLKLLVGKIMDETIAIANKDLEKTHGAEGYDPLNEDDKRMLMFLFDRVGGVQTSTMLDFMGGKPMEVKYLYREPVERAIKLGVSVPHLNTLVTQIEAHQRLLDLF